MGRKPSSALFPRVAYVQLPSESSSFLLLAYVSKRRSRNNGIFLSRFQLLLRGCDVIIINNSRGQTLSEIGLDLRDDVLTHGQLNVALGLTQKRDSIIFLALPSRLSGTFHSCAFVSKITLNRYTHTATDFDITSLPLPSPYVDCIG